MVSPPFELNVIVLETVFLLVLIFGKGKINPFVARKACHVVSGAAIMAVGNSTLTARLFVYTASVLNIVMTWRLGPQWLPELWFADRCDIGVTIYLITVSIWTYLRLPVLVLAPVFFSDPAGAVTGKLATRFLGKSRNPEWIFNKTVFGSVAVAAVTYFCMLTIEHTGQRRILLSLAAAGAEAVGGKFDNLAILVVCIYGYIGK